MIIYQVSQNQKFMTQTLTINKRHQTYFNLSLPCILLSFADDFASIVPFLLNLLFFFGFRRYTPKHWRHLLMICTLAIFVTFLLLIIRINYVNHSFGLGCFGTSHVDFSINTLLFSVIIWEGSFLGFRSTSNK